MLQDLHSIENADAVIDWGVFESNAAKSGVPARPVPVTFDGENQRKSPRYPVAAKINVWLDNGVMLEGCVRDLSMKGVWFDCINSIPMGNPVRVEIICHKPDACISVKVDGKVVRIREGGLAVAFSNVDGCQSSSLLTLLNLHKRQNSDR